MLRIDHNTSWKQDSSLAGLDRRCLPPSPIVPFLEYTGGAPVEEWAAHMADAQQLALMQENAQSAMLLPPGEAWGHMALGGYGVPHPECAAPDADSAGLAEASVMANSNGSAREPLCQRHGLQEEPAAQRAESVPPATIMSARRKDVEGGNAIELSSVTPLWMEVTATERCLLLEDADTGDILMPLFYMRAIFEANYSRKLASLKHRRVPAPPGSSLAAAQPAGCSPYWQWAFESPQHVKAVVKQALGDKLMPQGHLRLVLAPIVYNAMAQKACLRALPLFRALCRVLRASTYDPLLHHPPPHALPQVVGSTATEPEVRAPLFHGPRVLSASAAKYMITLRESEETEPVGSKRKSAREAKADEGGLARADSGGGCTDPASCSAALALLKRDCDKRIKSLTEELALLKTCILQLYTGASVVPGGNATSAGGTAAAASACDETALVPVVDGGAVPGHMF